MSVSNRTTVYPLSGQVSSALTSEYLFKRSLDFLLASVALVVSLPLWFLIEMAITLEDRGPLFYSQERVGKGGKRFKIMKFRSMVPDAETGTGPVWARENDTRVTRVGRILRATALDELPQLWNILKGDISFVGPRAERPEFVRKFRVSIAKYDLRHLVRPGLTGLAQVYGRYDSRPREKFRYELLYIKRQSLLLDLKLIALSLLITVRGRWEYRGKKFDSHRGRRRPRREGDGIGGDGQTGVRGPGMLPSWRESRTDGEPREISHTGGVSRFARWRVGRRENGD